MKKFHKKTMKFDGKTYQLKGTTYNREDAVILANDGRKSGYNVRINKRTGKGFGYGKLPMYALYVRKK